MERLKSVLKEMLEGIGVMLLGMISISIAIGIFLLIFYFIFQLFN